MDVMNSNVVSVSTHAEEVMIRALRNIRNLAEAPAHGGNRIVEDGAGSILNHTYDTATYLDIMDTEVRNALKKANYLIGEASSAYFGDPTGTENVPMFYTHLENQLIKALKNVLEFTEAPKKGLAYVGIDVGNNMRAHTYTPEFYFLTIAARVHVDLAQLGLAAKGGE